MSEPTEGQKAAGRWAKAQRGRLGLDQKAVAEVAGISKNSVGSFELGKSWPRTSTRAAIEDALHMETGDLAEYAYHFDQELEAMIRHPVMTDRVELARRMMERMAERRARGE